MSPDGSTKPSPEERLLRLIRGKAPAASAAARPAAAAAGAAAGAHKALAMTAMRWPALVGGGLGAVLVIEVVLLAMQVLRPLPEVPVPPIPEIPPTPPATQAAPPVDVPSLAGSVTRPLFVSSLTAASAGASAEVLRSSGPSTQANNLAARLTLMGIVAGDPPQAVIEDGESKRTYFVVPGQAVVEGAVLEQVLDNRVVLSLNGERITLSL